MGYAVGTVIEDEGVILESFVESVESVESTESIGADEANAPTGAEVA
jgi:hypothetical protein